MTHPASGNTFPVRQSAASTNNDWYCLMKSYEIRCCALSGCPASRFHLVAFFGVAGCNARGCNNSHRFDALRDHVRNDNTD